MYFSYVRPDLIYLQFNKDLSKKMTESSKKIKTPPDRLTKWASQGLNMPQPGPTQPTCSIRLVLDMLQPDSARLTLK